MIASIFGAIASYMFGSLLWRIALILGTIILVVWLARRLRHGANGDPVEGKTAGALILLVALAGATAGFGYSAIDRAMEQVNHTKIQARIEAENAALAANLDVAKRDAEVLRMQAERVRKLADAATARAADSDERVAKAQRERALLSKQLARRVRDVSKNADGTVPTVNPEWVRDYNSALGFVLPTPPADSGLFGSSADSANTVGTGEQPNEAGLLASEVTTADVLSTHIDNAEAAKDSAARLTELQNWYNALRTERNALINGESP